MNNKAKEIREKLDETKKIMIQNVNYTLERGEKLDHLVEKADDLRKEADDFRIKSKIIKEKLWWQNVRIMMAMIACGMILVIIIIIVAVLFFKNENIYQL